VYEISDAYTIHLYALNFKYGDKKMPSSKNDNSYLKTLYAKTEYIFSNPKHTACKSVGHLQ